MNKYQSFINRMYPLLIDYGRKNNLPNHLVDYMMKQLAYESNYGNSALARTHHNYGGYGYTGNGKYRNYKTDQDFINDYGSWFLRRRDIQNAKNINDYAKALKKYGYYEDSYDHYSSQLRNMRTLEKYMRDYNLNNIRKSTAILDQRIQQRLQQKPDATFVEPTQSTSAILTPADIITQRQKFNQFVQPNTFDNLRGQLMQNLNQLQYSTPQEYMQNMYQYDKGRDFGGYVDALPMFATGTDNNFAGDLVARLGGGDKAQQVANLAAQLTPGVGAYLDIKDAVKNPSFENIGLALLSTTADLATFGAASTGVKATLKAFKYLNQLRKERKAAAAARALSRGRERRIVTRLNKQKSIARKSAIDAVNPFDRVDDTVSTMHDLNEYKNNAH